jgi:hypothetical protein
MSAKDIVIKAIPSADARALVQRVHYSGKVVNNSTLNLGAFYAGRLEGAMQFGSPMDRRKVLPLVSGTEWNQMLELNRMAFTDALPRNSESRAMAQGGITTSLCYVRDGQPSLESSIPYATAVPALLSSVKGRFHTDYAFHLGPLDRRHLDELESVVGNLGITSFQGFASAPPTLVSLGFAPSEQSNETSNSSQKEYHRSIYVSNR